MFKFFLTIFILIGFISASEDMPTQEEVAKLYVATFNRAPDSAGLSYWVNSGNKLSAIAQSFFDQEETKALYPAGTSNSDFVTSVYQNLFNRVPDTAGLNYWENELNIGSFTKNSFIQAVINGAQNNDTSNDADILSNKTSVGLSFLNAGLDNKDDARSIMLNVSSDTASVTSALDSFGISLYVTPEIELVSDAGEDIYTNISALVHLYGNASSYFDPNAVSYTWSISSQPTGSAANLSSSTSSNISFTPDVAGTYIVNLVVSEGGLDSPVDSVSIFAEKKNDSSEIVGHVSIPDFTKSVSISGDYGYIVNNIGLEIVNISNPKLPKIVASIDTPDISMDIRISGSYAYIADSSSGLQVVDISNPLSPSIVASVDTAGIAYGLTIEGNYAYVADWYNGLQIVDISNPLLPFIIGSIDTPSFAREVSIVGDYAYVADSYSGVQIIDVSNPKLPAIARSIENIDNALDVDVIGDNVYITVGLDGLETVNISNLEYTETIDTLSYIGYTYKINIIDSYAYIAAGDRGLQILDISDPSTAKIADTIDTAGDAVNASIVGNYAYVADGYKGLQIIDISVFNNK